MLTVIRQDQDMPEISTHCNFGLFGGHRCQLVHYGFGRYAAHVTHLYTGDEATAIYMTVLYLNCTAIAALLVVSQLTAKSL
jgi:hypothetical protein